MDSNSSMEQQFIQKLTEVIYANLHNEHFGVSELAAQLGMSRVTLHRKVKSIVKKSVSEFIRETRLKQANELLKQKSGTVAEIAYEVGFGSATYFSKCFHDYFGYPPGETGNHEAMENKALIHEKSVKKNWVAIVTAVLFLTAIAVTTWVIVKPFTKNNNKKSIAVLPFVNDSADTTNVYFVNGLMEDIINRLSAIEDLRVVSRGSVELYRNRTDKTTRQIARELKVDYLVEGSCQKLGDQIKLSVQLIDGKNDNHLFSESYTRNNKDIFNLQSDIALSVATKINAEITPEEKIQIEKKPTNNIASYNYFLQAKSLNTVIQRGNWELYKEKETLLKKAIQLDSTYADPLVHLGWIYAYYHGDLDSAMIIANRALQCDSIKANALCLKGWILKSQSRYKESEKCLKLAIKHNPNAPEGYHMLGMLSFFLCEYAKTIEYKLKALRIYGNDPENSLTISGIRNYLTLYGLYEEALKFAQIQIETHNDSLGYYQCVTFQNISKGDYETAYWSAQGADKWAQGGNWWKFTVSVYQKDFEKALELPESIAKTRVEKGQAIYGNIDFAYVYMNSGNKEKADYHYENVIKWALDDLKKKDAENVWEGYSELMKVYSAKGDKTKAMEYFRKMKTSAVSPFYPLNLFYIKTHPIYETIRTEPEVQEFIRKNEAGLKSECVKIKKMLDEYWAEL